MKKIRLTVTAFFSIIILFTAFIVFFRLQTEAANRSTVDANLTLKNLDIRTSGCALDAGDGKVSIKFSGSNYVKSGAKYAGIRVQEGGAGDSLRRKKGYAHGLRGKPGSRDRQ